MPKNIVLLSDGTGNSAGKLFKTNVWRLYQALDLARNNPDGTPAQIAYYHGGVGSSAFKPLAIIGGAFGWGLKRTVIDLYTYLCRNYRDGDRVYCFGFSRGAFTIRVLTGLINSKGLVEADSEDKLRYLATESFNSYRLTYKTFVRLERPFRFARNVANGIVGFVKPKAPEAARRMPDITFLGLWDTVAAYGLPFDELTRAWNAFFPLSVPDREPCKIVKRACHALALDDERNTFHPVLWNELNLQEQGAATRIRDERISQVWFAGMHASVGGGYPDDALANISLAWIMDQAALAKLQFRPDEHKRIAESADENGKLHDSRVGLGGAYRYLPRKLAVLTNDVDDPDNQVVIRRPKIHESVFKRIKDGPDAYAPIVLPSSYSVVDAKGAIHDLPDSDASTELLEGRQRARDRANLQERVWDIVWYRRVVYFTSIFVSAALVLFPFFLPATDACEGRWCGVSWIVNAVGLVLPGVAAPWLDAWATHPAEFLALLAAFSLLLYLGGALSRRIADRMRSIWMRAPGTPAPAPGGWLYRMRTSAVYQWLWKRTKWGVLPMIAGSIAAIFIAAGVNQALFALLNSAGAVCAPSAGIQPDRDRLTNAMFTTDTVCWASGFLAREGVRYRITLDIAGRWQDDLIVTDVNGFGREKISGAMFPLLLVRRHLGEPWFKPIVRIGNLGNDEYPLYHSDALNKDTADRMTAEFTARRSGEVFLFVNDAVLAGPVSWQLFYGNNLGSATVTIVPRGVPKATRAGTRQSPE